MFVDHEPEESVESIPIVVVAPMLLISQSPSKVEIHYCEEDVTHHTSQPLAHEPPKHPPQQLPQQPTV
jgi:hypothetical protein